MLHQTETASRVFPCDAVFFLLNKFQVKVLPDVARWMGGKVGIIVALYISYLFNINTIDDEWLMNDKYLNAPKPKK